MSQLSPSVDLESSSVAVSPRHACLRLSYWVDGRRRIFADRVDCRRLAVRIGQGEHLHHLPFRHFELCDNDGLVLAVHFGMTAAHQLRGPQRGEDDELKRADTSRTLNHRPPLARRGSQAIRSAMRSSGSRTNWARLFAIAPP